MYLWLIKNLRISAYKCSIQRLIQQFRDARDYEGLELYILQHLLGMH